MRINVAGTGGQNQVKLPIPEIEKSQKNSSDPSQVSKLIAEIKLAQF